MVELADTQDLESCGETRAGSIPVIRTNNMKFLQLNGGFLLLKNKYSFI